MRAEKRDLVKLFGRSGLYAKHDIETGKILSAKMTYAI